MKLPVLFFVFTVFSLQMCSQEKDYRPSSTLEPREQQAFLWSVIHYLGRIPEGVRAGDRFNPRYDSFYLEQVGFHRLEAYYASGERNYFLISRRAPSLYDRRVATGGYVTFGVGGKVTDYEEVFRTWKMDPDTLIRRGFLLFDKMVNGEDLKPFETRNSGNTDYIEFPDAQTWYDKGSRSWKSGSRPVN